MVQINLLQLQAQTLTTPRSSPAARCRFIHIPPVPGLFPLPSSLLSVVTTPLGRIIVSSALGEVFGAHNRPVGIIDESVDSFFTRRFGPDFARKLGSSLVHGVYAADSRKLSVRAAFPSMWKSEERGRGSVLWGEIGPPAWSSASARQAEAAKKESEEEFELDPDPVFQEVIKNASVISFKDGIEQLVGALVGALEKMPNVELRKDTAVTALSQDKDTKSIEVCESWI